MRFTPTSTYTTYANAISPSLMWNAYFKNVTALSESLDSGSWTDVTDYIPNGNFSFKSSTEFEIGQYKSDSVSVTALSVSYWKNNVFTTSFLGDSTQYIEFKFTLRVGLNDSFASDIVIPFSGFVDRNTIAYSETSDTVSFSVYTADSYLSKIIGERYTMQNIRPDVYSTTDGLVLMNIPGVWVTNATGSTPLKQGVHTLTWDFISGSAAIKLDDGNNVTIATASNNTYSVPNRNSTQQVTVATNYLFFVTGSYTQDLIMTGSAVYPATWNQRIWIYKALKDLYGYAGISNYTFDNFRIKTYDGRKILSYYDIPPGDTFYNDVLCLDYVSGSKDLWLGIGDKIYKRNMVDNTYTNYSSGSSGYNIVRLFTNHINDNKVYAIGKNSSNAVKIFKLNVSSSVYTTSSLSGRGTTDTTIHFAGTNYAYIPTGSASTSGSLYYLGSTDKKVKFFDLNTFAETDTGYVLSSSFYGTASNVLYACAGWSSGSHYYCQSDLGTSNYQLHRVYCSGSWTSEVMLGTPSTTILNPLKSGVWNPAERRFIGTVPLSITAADVYGDGNVYGIFTVNVGANSYGELFATASSNHTYFNGATYLFDINNKRYASLTGSAVTNSLAYFTTMSFSNGDSLHYGQKSFYAGSEDKFFGVTRLNNLLYEFSATSSMYIDTELKGTDESLFDMLTKILKAYNLVGSVNANKKVYIYRRGDDTGAPITITSGSTITHDLISDIIENVNKFAKISYIKVSNDDNSTTYDGTNFDSVVLRDVRSLELSNELLPTVLLNDIAYYFYQFFKTNRTLYRVELPFLPLFNLEPFDGVTLSLPTRNINVSGAGVIYSVDNKNDGTTILEILI